MADELNITTPNELEEWLKDKPVEWAQVIAVRAALRVLPLVGQVYRSNDISIDTKDKLILSTYRACFLSLVARKYPAEDLKITAYSAARATDSVADAAGAAFAASRAAFAAARTADATANAIDASARAADVVGAALTSARAAFAPVRDKWKAFSLDADWLVARHRYDDGIENTWIIAGFKLWPDSEPDWARDECRKLNQKLIDNSPHHQVWIDWYNNVLDGKPFFDLSPDREKALTLKIVQQENDFWEQDFAKVSGDISSWLEEARKRDAKRPDSHELDPWKVDLLEIPMPHPATLEPVWQNGHLVLPSSPLNDDLKGASIGSALAALKSDFAEFVTEIGNDANIDQRASGYLSKIAEDIPDAPPPQNELFSLAHKEQFFIGYAKTVSEEWPEFLAARFHALGLQFSRVMKQFPEWREFKANADQNQLTSDEIENIEQLAIAMEKSLREELAMDFVDQGIADIIADMASQLVLETDSITPEQADEFIQSGKDLLAADLLSSIDNIVKRIAEKMLAEKGLAIKFIKYSGGHLGGAMKEEYEVQLKKLGKDVVKWGMRLLKGSVVGGGTTIASIPLGQWLITNYPTTFSWLEPILKFFV